MRTPNVRISGIVVRTPYAYGKANGPPRPPVGSGMDGQRLSKFEGPFEGPF